MSRDLGVTVPTAGVGSLRLVLAVGEIEVRGDGGSELRAELSVHCRRNDSCADKIENVHLDTARRGDRLIFTISGYPALLHSDNMHVQGVIHVPAGLPLDIDMRVGELRVNDVGSGWACTIRTFMMGPMCPMASYSGNELIQYRA